MPVRIAMHGHKHAYALAYILAGGLGSLLCALSASYVDSTVPYPCPSPAGRSVAACVG